MFVGHKFQTLDKMGKQRITCVRYRYWFFCTASFTGLKKEFEGFILFSYEVWKV